MFFGNIFESLETESNAFYISDTLLITEEGGLNLGYGRKNDCLLRRENDAAGMQWSMSLLSGSEHKT